MRRCPRCRKLRTVFVRTGTGAKGRTCLQCFVILQAMTERNTPQQASVVVPVTRGACG